MVALFFIAQVRYTMMLFCVTMIFGSQFNAMSKKKVHAK